MTPKQSRAARALLNWSQGELAEASSVSLSTVRDFEKGRHMPIANNLAAIRKAFEQSKIMFFGETGVISMNEAHLLTGGGGKALGA